MRVHKDLASYVKEMAEFNGLGRDAYVNGLPGRSIRSELEESFTPESVLAFLIELRTNKRPDRRLLKYLSNGARARELPAAPA